MRAKKFFIPLFIFSFSLLISFCESRKENNKIKTENGNYLSFSEMDKFLNSQMDSLHLPGLSFAIINDAEIVYYRTLGIINVNTNEKVSQTMLFDAGSMTKTPFAFLVMKMVEQGILNLDQPLYTYLPYPDIAYDDRYKLITARMVLSHTSGFPNWRSLNKDGKLDIKFTPGTKYLYSGEGFEYLADVVAHLKKNHKNDLQDLFAREVATPLGIQCAYFTWNDYVAEHQANGHFDGQLSWGWGLSPDKTDFGASYSLQTEATGYAKFIIALIQEKGLKKKTYDEMLKPQILIPSETDSVSYCLGIKRKPTRFGTEYFHDGYNRNFSSAFMFNKKRKFGYAFFTNCEKGMVFNENLEFFLINKKSKR